MTPPRQPKFIPQISYNFEIRLGVKDKATEERGEVVVLFSRIYESIPKCEYYGYQMYFVVRVPEECNLLQPRRH
jgi:hypothetical protein